MANRFVLNTISYHGSGAIKEIPGELQRRGYKKIFVCSDPDLVKFGVTAKVTDELDAAGIAWSLYSEIKPNPTIQNVKDGVEAFKAAEADAIVTIGGGSSMDTAKAIGIIINNPEFADVRSLEGNVQELDSFFWLLKLHYIVCKLFETMSMIRNDDDSLFHLLRNHHLQKGYRSII